MSNPSDEFTNHWHGVARAIVASVIAEGAQGVTDRMMQEACFALLRERAREDTYAHQYNDAVSIGARTITEAVAAHFAPKTDAPEVDWTAEGERIAREHIDGGTDFSVEALRERCAGPIDEALRAAFPRGVGANARSRAFKNLPAVIAEYRAEYADKVSAQERAARLSASLLPDHPSALTLEIVLAEAARIDALAADERYEEAHKATIDLRVFALRAVSFGLSRKIGRAALGV